MFGKKVEYTIKQDSLSLIERWNYVLPNSGQTMFSAILEFCRGLNDVVQTSQPIQQCRTFQRTIPQEIGGQSSVRKIHILLQILLPPRMPSSRRNAPTRKYRKYLVTFRQPSALTQSGQQDS